MNSLTCCIYCILFSAFHLLWASTTSAPCRQRHLLQCHARKLGETLRKIYILFKCSWDEVDLCCCNVCLECFVALWRIYIYLKVWDLKVHKGNRNPYKNTTTLSRMTHHSLGWSSWGAPQWCYWGSACEGGPEGGEKPLMCPPLSHEATTVQRKLISASFVRMVSGNTLGGVHSFTLVKTVKYTLTFSF